MKKITSILFGILFIASVSHAGTVTKDSSWEEILADPSLKVVFPVVSVGNGKYVSYNHLFQHGDKLTTGKTWQDPAEVKYDTSSIDRDREKDPIVIRTVERKTETPLNYTYNECTEFNTVKEHGEDREPLVCSPVTGRHAQTLSVSVYKRGRIVNGGENSDNNRDIFLFKKEYSVPVHQVQR